MESTVFPFCFDGIRGAGRMTRQTAANGAACEPDTYPFFLLWQNLPAFIGGEDENETGERFREG